MDKIIRTEIKRLNSQILTALKKILRMQNEYVSSNPLILLNLVAVHSFLFDYYYTYTNILSISPLL